MASEQFSLRISKKTKDRLEMLAQATGRSKAFVAIEAIEKYCEMESWQISAIQKGLKQAEEGEFVLHEDIKAHWEKK